jgi:formamidopyrimidine-DNA glycosylase
MPELPEVEAARRLAEANILNKTIIKAIVADDDKVFQGNTPSEFQQHLEEGNIKVIACKRRGKHLYFMLSSQPHLYLHFGMTGSFVIKGIGAAHYKNFSVDDATWPPRFCKLQLEFNDGTTLAFCDSRRFARSRLLSDPENSLPINKLGWDPLIDPVTATQFTQSLTKAKRSIKAVLLDQSFIAGIGNWVADEVLFQARIHPEQPANSIPVEKSTLLYNTILDVCTHASHVEADYHRFPKEWLFHYRWGKGSSTVAKVMGHTVKHITVAGRTSAYAPTLQKLKSRAAVVILEDAKVKGKRVKDDDENGEMVVAVVEKKEKKKRKVGTVGVVVEARVPAATAIKRKVAQPSRKCQQRVGKAGAVQGRRMTRSGQNIKKI